MPAPILPLLEAQPKARQVRPGAWVASCPAHEDANPSLSWTTNGDGNVGVKCFAGCSAEAIVGALGEPMSSLFEPRPTNGHAVGVTIRPEKPKATEVVRTRRFQATDTAGRVWTHTRREDATGRAVGAMTWQQGVRLADLLPYGVELVATWPDEDPVFLVEGEATAETLRAAGLPAIATYGTSYKPERAALVALTGRRLILWPDADDTGRAHMLDMANRLDGIAAALRWIEPPADVFKGWDGSDADPDTVALLVRDARTVPAVTNVTTPDVASTRPDFRSAASIAEPVDVDRVLVEGVVRPASLLVIGASEGTAKTQIICELGIRASTGAGSLFGHYAIPTPLRVMVLDEENGEAELWRRESAILDVLGLERSALTGYYRASFAGMVLTELASQEWLVAQVAAIQPDLLILDTGTSMVGEEWGIEMKAAMRYIRSLIARYGCAVAVLVHMVKPSRDRRPNDPAHGSAMSHVMGQWTRVADSVALIADLGAGRLRWEMRKKVPPSTLILVKRDGVFDVVSIGEARKPSSDDRVLRAIAAGGAGPDDIAAALELGKRTVSDAIARLRKDGLIESGYPYQLTDDGRGAIE